MTTILVTGLVLWLAIAISWLICLPAQASAKSWHYIHAVIPGVILLIAYLAPPDLQAVMGRYLECGLLLLVCMSFVWLIGQTIKNHSIMDIAYASIGSVSAIFLFVSVPGPATLRRIVLLALVLIWTGRLLAHTSRTNFRVEQQPYAGLRKRYGASWPVWSYFSVYMLQGIMCWVWVSSFAFAMAVDKPALTLIDFFGIAFWVVGFAFQAIGDHQLKIFKDDPANAGKLMQSGLWSITRHPNYFGEAMMWTGYFLFALDHPWGWLAVVSPIYVAWFMCFGSAVPGNERHMRKTRPDYDAYARRVARFVPWVRMSSR